MANISDETLQKMIDDMIMEIHSQTQQRPNDKVVQLTKSLLLNVGEPTIRWLIKVMNDNEQPIDVMKALMAVQVSAMAYLMVNALKSGDRIESVSDVSAAIYGSMLKSSLKALKDKTDETDSSV